MVSLEHTFNDVMHKLIRCRKIIRGAPVRNDDSCQVTLVWAREAFTESRLPFGLTHIHNEQSLKQT